MKSAFERLPPQQKALIRASLNALNRAKSWEQTSVLALVHGSRRAAKPNTPSVRAEDMAPALAALLQQDAEGASEFWHEYWQHDFTSLRQTLMAIARTGRIPAHAIDDLVATFEADVVVEPRVNVRDGRAEIGEHLRFRNGMAAIAYSVLRLSQLGSARDPVLVCCAECEVFELRLSTGGDKISRFCSPKCRNRFNQREWRKNHPRSAKHK